MQLKKKLVFSDLIDVEKAQELMSGYYAVTQIPTAIIDGAGKVWTADGWLDICTKFHRVNPETAEMCRESDTYIAQHLNSGKSYISYRCAHGLTDVASPIIVAGQHVAHVMTGQLFLKKPDIEFFRNQARRFDFNEEAYLKALAEVPVITRERLDTIMMFLSTLAQFLADLGYKRLGEQQARKELQKAHATLERKVEERTTELKAAKDSAEAANKAKSAFLAHMSHELRTPLNAVLGFAQILKSDSDATPQQVRHLDIITGSGEHLLHLINNVLDISKIESGHVQLETTSTDLHNILQAIESLMHVKAHEKGLYFAVNQGPDLPRHVMIDAGKLRQVLINLVGNAVKYTRTGRVILTAESRQGESLQSARIRFAVEDSGPGIDKENIARIFSPFEQLPNQPATETGTGLGLTICQQYVELMGGTLDVESEPGSGTIFSFTLTLPIAPGDEVEELPLHSRVIGIEEGQKNYRLLIVEDHPANRLLLHNLLRPYGFDLREATNGREAVNLVEQWQPDLIWMDIRMPVMDGSEATRRIRGTSKGAHTKIIALTAHALEEERLTILSSGFDDFIRKPYRDGEIYDVLTRHLGIRFRYAAPSPAQQVSPESGEITAEQLATLPPHLTDRLAQAVELLDGQQIVEQIQHISEIAPVLGATLAKMAENIQYKEMLGVLDRLAAIRTR